MTTLAVRHVVGQSWADRAACRGDDPEVFHPTTAGKVGRNTILPAAIRCAACPVIAECTQLGTFPSVYLRTGIYGGWWWPNRPGPPIDVLHAAGLTAQPRTWAEP